MQQLLRGRRLLTLLFQNTLLLLLLLLLMLMLLLSIVIGPRGGSSAAKTRVGLVFGDRVKVADLGANLVRVNVVHVVRRLHLIGLTLSSPAAASS